MSTLTELIWKQGWPPGVESVTAEDGSMVVRFQGGVEVTVKRSFLAWMGDETFEIWLPRDEESGLAHVMPKLSAARVIEYLNHEAEKAAGDAGRALK